MTLYNHWVSPLFGLYTHYPLVKSIKVLDFNLIFKFILVLIFTTLTLNIYKLGSPPSYSFPILFYSPSILDSKLHVLVIIFLSYFKNILFYLFSIFIFVYFYFYFFILFFYKLEPSLNLNLKSWFLHAFTKLCRKIIYNCLISQFFYTPSKN